jgi:hypothetical protein
MKDSSGTLGVGAFYAGRLAVIKVIRVVVSSSIKRETVKYGLKSQGARTKERLRWQGPEAYIKVRPVLSSERAPHKKKTP